MRALRIPALVAGVACIASAVTLGVLGARSAQERAVRQDAELGTASRQAATTLTQVFERVRAIDLMLAADPSFVHYALDPRPAAVKMADPKGSLPEVKASLAYLDKLLPDLDSAGFSDSAGDEVARFSGGQIAVSSSLSNIKPQVFFAPAMTLGPGKVFRSNPYLSDLTGRSQWVITHSTQIASDGRVYGVVYFSVPVSVLASSAFADLPAGVKVRVVAPENGQVLIDSSRQLTADTSPAAEKTRDKTFVHNNLLSTHGVATSNGQRLALASLESDARDDGGSGWVVVASVPVVGVSGWLSGWLVVGLLVVGLLLVALGVVGWVGVVRGRRLAALVAVGERDVLAERLGVVSSALVRVGGGDLGVVLPVEEFASSDVVLGGLVGGFEDTIGRLRVLVGSAQDAGAQVATSAGELLVLAGRQADSAGEQSAAVTETTVTIQELAATASQIAESAGGVAVVAGEMLALTEAGRTAVSDSVAAMGRIAGRVGSIRESTAVLGDKVAEIGGILVLLDDLSDQTNLLALNAAIEAARAGEHGRGFAVVAGEVRKLAERARASTGRIQGLVTEIRGLMEATVVASSAGAGEVETGSGLAADAVAVLAAIAGRVEEAAASVKEISVATRQQRSASEQVVVAMTRLSQVSTMYAAGSRQAEASAQELAGLAASMQASIETFRTSSNPDTDTDTASVEENEAADLAEDAEVSV